MSKHIIVDVDKCIGCHTCELACAMAHSESGDLELMVLKGERPRYRLRVETTGSKPTVVTCQHGEDAECIEACEFDAVKRLSPGRPVLVDNEACTACRKCVKACPYGMIEIQRGKKYVVKCDLCIERQAQHLEPACVASCPTKALSLGDDEPVSGDKGRTATQSSAV